MLKTSCLKKLARHLLATTCLTGAVATAAYAGPFVSGVTPSTSSGSPTVETVTPGGVSVSGSLPGAPGANYYLEFEGLTGGASFGSLALAITNGGSIVFDVTILSDTLSTIDVGAGVGGGLTYYPGGTVPGDGNFIVELTKTNEAAAPYSVTMGTPEPGTWAAVGLGLVGLGALARRRKKN